VTENVAVVTPRLLVNPELPLASPSTFKVTTPAGATFPSGGLPTVSVTVTEMVCPGVTDVADGTTARLVVLG